VCIYLSTPTWTGRNKTPGVGRKIATDERHTTSSV
jgi:hypothetical protein